MKVSQNKTTSCLQDSKNKSEFELTAEVQD